MPGTYNSPEGKIVHIKGEAELISILSGLSRGDLAACYALLQKCRLTQRLEKVNGRICL